MVLVREPFDGSGNHAFRGFTLLRMRTDNHDTTFTARARHDGRRIDHDTDGAAVFRFFGAVDRECFECGQSSFVVSDDRTVFVFQFECLAGLAEKFLAFWREFDLHRSLAALPFGRNSSRIQHADSPIKTVAREICAGANAHVSPALFDKVFHVGAALVAEGFRLSAGGTAGEHDDIKLIEDAIADLFAGNFGDVHVFEFPQLGANAWNAFTRRAGVLIERDSNRLRGSSNKAGAAKQRNQAERSVRRKLEACWRMVHKKFWRCCWRHCHNVP